MNKKGQMNGFSIILVAFMAIIVGVVLFQVIAQEVGSSTNTISVANESLTGAAVDGTAQYLTSYRAISDVDIYNATGDVEIPDDNYTVVNNVIHPTTGDLCVSITPASPAPELGYNVGTWTIDGTAQPLTYIADSGGRAMASLIVVFFALAVAVIALEPTLRSGILSAFGK